MKTILKSLMMASLLLAPATASAQNELLEAMPEMLQKEFSIEPKKSLNQERDVQTRLLKSRCDIYSFTLTRKQQEKVFKGLKDCFESAGNDKNCYSVNSMNDLTGKESLRNLVIGDDVNRYVTIGQDYTNYINVNILDAKDTTKTHRYAYALEWRETSGTSEKGAIDVRFIITYGKIPSAVKTLTYSGKVTYPDLLDRLIDIDGKWFPKDSTSLINDVMNDNGFLDNFNRLNDYYWKYSTSVTTAISIYQLCKLGREFGAFKRPESTEDWEKLVAEVDKLIECAKTETDRKYFVLAREELQKMKGK